MLSRIAFRTVDQHVSSESEAALVRDMIAGDKRAWREFHARYDRLVLRCISKVTTRFRAFVAREDAVEIYSNLLVTLCANDMAKLRSFDHTRGQRLSSFIGVIAINCAYDHLRTLRSEPLNGPIDEEAEEVSEEAPTPDQVLQMKQALVIVNEALCDLSDKDREFVSLYYDEGLDVEQIAERMQISVKTVYSKKHKIQTRIEARLFSEPRMAA
jgi:RNA polymerase sigma-70 factor (ECF subfamily)